MTDDAQPNRKPVTTRDIAAFAGVSNATVSLALRNHPRISQATRTRVQRAAQTLGYRPDPQIAKLMHRLRMTRAPGFQSTIAAITTVPESLQLRYLHDIIQSARNRAESLGHAFMILRPSEKEVKAAALQRILLSRGVEGLLILPMLSPGNIEGWLDWRYFAVVTATYSVTTPDFHRVVPHQFGNSLRLCRELARLGYQRIGLVHSKEHDIAVHHGFSGAVAWHNLIGGSEMVRPLIHENADASDLERWFAAEKPDVIITSGEPECRLIAHRLGLSIPGPVGFAVMDWYGQPDLAGIDEHPSAIGAAAVNLLNTEIISGNLGIPDVPTITMISGKWVPGPSAGRLQESQNPG